MCKTEFVISARSREEEKAYHRARRKSIGRIRRERKR